MTQVAPISQFTCPGCSVLLVPQTSAHAICPACRWKGQAYLFSQFALTAAAAESALQDDATCVHHPRKKATTVCEGTGDYICSLCAVEVNGRTFSAEFLNTGGKETLGKAFDRTLPRPDSHIRLYFILLFVPYINFIVIAFAFLWIPHAFYLYSKALRQREQDPLFRRVMSTARLVLLPTLLVLLSILWVIGVVSAAVAILNSDL